MTLGFLLRVQVSKLVARTANMLFRSALPIDRVELLGRWLAEQPPEFGDLIFKKVPSAERLRLLKQGFFEHFGAAPAPEVVDIVSNFSAFDRDKWVQGRLEAIPSGVRVLDAGAGQCRYKSFLEHTNYYAQDFAQYQGSSDGILQESWQYGKLDYVCDITEIPVESGFFDVVLCTEVLEHVPRPVDALKELVRILKPGGKIILTVPLGSGVHQEPYHYYGGFSKYFFGYFAEQFNLELVECRELGGLLKHTAQEMARAARVLRDRQIIDENEEKIIGQYLPSFLFSQDAQCFVEQFTVGYLVEMQKK